jgi:hypothetical protein
MIEKTGKIHTFAENCIIPTAVIMTELMLGGKACNLIEKNFHDQ